MMSMCVDRKKIWLLAALTAVVGSGANTLWAATTSTTFQVTANIAKNCVIDSAGILDFTTYDPTSASPLDNSSNIVVRCTKATPFDIGLNAGTGAGATVATRKMGNGVDTLDYSLFTTAARSTVWGNTVGADTVSDIGLGLGAAKTITKTVFGRIPPSQDVSPGNYADTITVTVTF